MFFSDYFLRCKAEYSSMVSIFMMKGNVQIKAGVDKCRKFHGRDISRDFHPDFGVETIFNFTFDHAHPLWVVAHLINRCRQNGQPLDSQFEW